MGILWLSVTTLWLAAYRMAIPAESRITAPFAYSSFCVPSYRAIEIDLNKEQQLSFNLEPCNERGTGIKRRLQAAAIHRLAAKHHLLVNPQQLAQLAGLAQISMGIDQLVCGPAPRHPQASAGLSATELQEWIVAVRETGAAVFQLPIYIDIRADGRCGAAGVQRLLRLLRNMEIYRVNFVTQQR